jgi:hypothetical protein
MFRSATCFCILLLLIGAVSALTMNPSVVKVSAPATIVQRMTQTSLHPAVASCGAGAVNCNGKCTNLNFDELNCGSCGMTCFDPAVCCNGECVDLMYDETNCGSCGMTCFEPAKCCKGSCKATCNEIAQIKPTPSEIAQIKPTPSEIAQVKPTPSEIAQVKTPTLAAVHGLTAPYRNITLVTPVPQDCPPPSEGWSCMQLAKAKEQFGYLFAVHGNVPCGYITEDGHTIAEYCCKAAGGLVSPSFPGAAGIRSPDTSLHIIDRTPAAAGGPGQGKVYGRIVGQRPDFISTIFSLFAGFFAKPVSCGEGTVNCNGRCTNINFDNTNCGTCGMTCFDPAVCCNGECVDLQSDDANCGTCGMTCFLPATCCFGSCEETCPGKPAPMVVETPQVAGMATVTPVAVGMVVKTPQVAGMVAGTPAP